MSGLILQIPVKAYKSGHALKVVSVKEEACNVAHVTGKVKNNLVVDAMFCAFVYGDDIVTAMYCRTEFLCAEFLESLTHDLTRETASNQFTYWIIHLTCTSNVRLTGQYIHPAQIERS